MKTVAAHQPYGYAASGHYVADSVGARHIAKREAEADAYYGSYGYGGYGAGYGAVLATGTPALAGAYAAPATSAAIAVRGYGTPATIGAYQPYGYAASGHYRANSVGAVHIANNNVYSGFTGNHYAIGLPGHSYAAVTRFGKREAEPTAEPFYGHSYGHGYGYGYAGPVATGVSTVSHAGFPLQGYAQGYGYGHGYYGY